MDILEKVEGIFKDFFDDETLVITRATTASDIEDWDSLAQMNLVVIMEKEFNMKFKIDEIATLHNVGEMIDLIKSRI